MSLNSPDLLRALRNRNYKLYFGGQGLSLIGTWMTLLATSWLVYRLSFTDGTDRSAYYLGLVGFASQLPILILTPFAGVIVDRVNRHRLLIITQILSLLQSAALAVLALKGSITIPQVLWLCAFQGVVSAFDMPARQSFMVEIIENRDDLPNAIALNSSMFNIARLLGPAMAGLLIQAVGEGYCFLIDAFSYIAVVAALLGMVLPKKAAEIPRRHVFTELKEGVAYSLGFTPIWALLMLVAMISFAAMPVMTLLPIIAVRLSDKEHGAQVLGFLRAASGIGALGGGIYLAARKSVVGLGRVIIVASLVLGVTLAAFSQTTELWLSMLAMSTSGFGLITVMASANTLLQTILEDDKRGRVMSFYVTALLGAAPLGSYAAGRCAARWGESRTILGSAVFCLIAGLIFAFVLPRLNALVRPIFQKKGILANDEQNVATADVSSTPNEP